MKHCVPTDFSHLFIPGSFFMRNNNKYRTVYLACEFHVVFVICFFHRTLFPFLLNNILRLFATLTFIDLQIRRRASERGRVGERVREREGSRAGQ